MCVLEQSPPTLALGYSTWLALGHGILVNMKQAHALKVVAHVDLSSPTTTLSESCTYLYLNTNRLTCSMMSDTVSSYIHCPNWQPGGHPRQTSRPARPPPPTPAAHPCTTSLKNFPVDPQTCEQEKKSGCFKPPSMRWFVMQQWITNMLIIQREINLQWNKTVSRPICFWVSGSIRLAKPLPTLLKTTPSFSLTDFVKCTQHCVKVQNAGGIL